MGRFKTAPTIHLQPGIFYLSCSYRETKESILEALKEVVAKMEADNFDTYEWDSFMGTGALIKDSSESSKDSSKSHQTSEPESKSQSAVLDTK